VAIGNPIGDCLVGEPWERCLCQLEEKLNIIVISDNDAGSSTERIGPETLLKSIRDCLDILPREGHEISAVTGEEALKRPLFRCDPGMVCDAVG